MDFQEADRRFPALKQQYDNGDLSDDEYRAQLEQLAVQDAEGRWWVKHRDTGAWHYQDGDSWVQSTPYPEPGSGGSNIGVQATPGSVPRDLGVLERIARMMNRFPPLRERKKPWIALVVGFLPFGIALGPYFRSWRDLIVLAIIWVLLFAVSTPFEADLLIGAVIGGVWGLLRAVNSNERLTTGRSQQSS
jgi:hypothetical protein